MPLPDNDANLEPAHTDSGHSEPAHPEPAHSESVHSESAHPKSAHPNSGHHELPHPEPDIAINTSYVLICERQQVEQVLQQLLQMQTSLAIQINTPEGIRTTQSTVLRIEHTPAPPHVILHQPEQASWYRFLQDKPLTKINGHLPGGRLSFSTRLAPLDAIVEDSFYCRFPFPAEIRKYQLRASFRVAVVPGTSMVMILIAANRIAGECLDLSIGGCRLILQPGFAGLHEKSELDNLVIELNGAASLTVSVKVCRISTTKSGRLIVSAQYLDLTPQQRKQLQTALSRMQRQQLQTKIRLT